MIVRDARDLIRPHGHRAGHCKRTLCRRICIDATVISSDSSNAL